MGSSASSCGLTILFTLLFSARLFQLKEFHSEVFLALQSLLPHKLQVIQVSIAERASHLLTSRVYLLNRQLPEAVLASDSTPVGLFAEHVLKSLRSILQRVSLVKK